VIIQIPFGLIVVLIWCCWMAYELRSLTLQKKRNQELMLDGWIATADNPSDYEAAFRSKRKRLIAAMVMPPVALALKPFLHWTIG